MAPEVYNRDCYNCKADTFGWAMKLIQMLTGKKPCPHMTLPVHKVLVLEGGGRPSLMEFPPDLQHILRRSWVQSVEQRWTMDRVCEALEPYFKSESMHNMKGVAKPTSKTQLAPKLFAAMRKQRQPCPAAHTVLAVAA